VSAGTAVGTDKLTKLISKRDRIILPIWAYALIGSAASTAYSIKGLFPDEAARKGFAQGISATSGVVALYGKVLNDSVGAITAWRYAVLGAVLAAIMSTLLVVRHTRAEEQSGRQELIAAGVVDRVAPLVSTLRMVIAVNVLAAVVIGAVFPFLGLPAAGAFALGFAVAGCGVFFTGLAAVSAQLFESSRTANAFTLVLLAVFYLVRAIGDIGHSTAWLLWASPLGWTEQVHAYAGDRWWVLAVPAVATAVLIAVALRLLDKRDYGAGVWPGRPGPRYAGPATRGVYGLAWRLHRGTMIGWTIGLFAAALILGSVANHVGVLTDSGRVRQIMADLGGTKNMSDAFVASVMGMFGIVTAVFTLTVITRARAEESGGRIEPVLSQPPSRYSWLLSHTVFAVFGAAVILFAAGFGAGLAKGIGEHKVGRDLNSLLGAAFSQLPGVVLVAAIAVLVFAVLPGYTAAAWGLLGVFAFLSLFGPELKVSKYVLDLSPFTHAPKLPGTAVTVLPLVVMSAIAVASVVASLAAFRERDLLA